MSDKFIFNSDKKKSVTFNLSFENIDPKNLNYYFRFISENNIEYSFPGKLQSDGKIRVEIPPLENVIKEEIKSGNYKSKFEVLGENFYSTPWKGEVELKVKPKVNMEAIEEIDNENISNNSNISISDIIQEDEDLDSNEEVINKVKSSSNVIKKTLNKLSESKKSNNSDIVNSLLLPDWYKTKE